MSLNKLQKLLKISKMLYDNHELYSSNQAQQKELNLDARTYNRYLNTIIDVFADYMEICKQDEVKNGKNVKVYKKININEKLSDFLKFFFEESYDDLVYFFPLIYEKNPDILKTYNKEDKKDIEKIIKKDDGIFLFRTNPYENISDTSKFFSLLKYALKKHEYLDIQYKYINIIEYKNIKPLKLIFSEDNWYIAIEHEQKLKLLRISFIQNIQKSQSKNTFLPNTTRKYSDYFKNMQNSMSLQGVDKQVALLKASKKVAMYFQKNAKLFFKSQKFISENNDGSITFEILYTQALEILPFVKKWIPDIEIISPKSLQDEFKNDLKNALEKINKG